MIVIDLGDRVRSKWGPVTNKATGIAVDPPLVLFIVRRPDGEELVSIYGESNQPYTVFRESAGTYYVDVPIVVIEGQGRINVKWSFRWVAFDEVGDPMKANERLVPVRKSLFTTPLPAIT